MDYTSIGKIKLVGACSKSIIVVTESNRMFMLRDFLQHTKENDKTGVREASEELFNGGNILRIGGKYQNRYAIVENWDFL